MMGAQGWGREGDQQGSIENYILTGVAVSVAMKYRHTLPMHRS